MNNENASLELLPCPFCGAQAVLKVSDRRTTGHGESDDDVFVKCVNEECGAQIVHSSYSGYQIEERKLLVIKRWNFRQHE